MTPLALLLALSCRSKVDTGSPTDSSPVVSEDLDGDGYTDDCDDNNPDVHAGAAEICDGLDNDCNELVDDSPTDGTTWYADTDGDGYGDADDSQDACEMPAGYVANDEDCNDTDARYNPGAPEYDCEDPEDYNCDGSVGYVDSDADGFAACAECDDSDADINPDADEVCNDQDDNCNGFTDDEDPLLSDGTTYYADSDNDGFGGNRLTVEACEAPDGYVDNSDDCDDLEADTYPDAHEVCDEEDNDCDGDTDEDVESIFYADDDGDGYGEPGNVEQACDAPSGYVANNDDCDDDDAATSPAAYEICDEEDNDCDGDTDEDSAIDASTWYADDDGDDYGDSSDSQEGCEQPSGYVSDDTDCDDTDADINPGETEVWYDGTDSDCDGGSDYDQDGDGYDSDDYSGDDCDDTDASKYEECVLYTFSSHTFTPCSAEGHEGPTLAACKTAYSTDWDSDSDYFSMDTQGVQLWTVPEDGDYSFEVYGAASGENTGYTSYPGRGAYEYGEFTLTQGDVIQILVGQRGETVYYHTGGGGGSFVVEEDNTPMIIAGGGGSACRGDDTRSSYTDATSSTSGVNTACNGGSGGDGGESCSGSYGPGGGGFSGDGADGPTSGSDDSTGGSSFLNGGEGGDCCCICGSNAGEGGFGGGGGTYHDVYGGGGGGYSGGGGGSYCTGGGGGGSYNNGSNSSSSTSANDDDGYVTVTRL